MFVCVCIPIYLYICIFIRTVCCNISQWTCVHILLTSSIDFPGKSMHIQPLLMPFCHPPASANTHYVSKPHKPRPWGPLFWITLSLCCHSKTASALSCLELLIFALIVAMLSTNEVKRLLKARFWSLCAATAHFACLPRQLRSMGLGECVLNRNAEGWRDERGGGGGEREEIFQEGASESGNYSLTTPPPPTLPTDRVCLETNLAPKAQPVWYAAQSNNKASGQMWTQQWVTCTPVDTCMFLQLHAPSRIL